MTFQPQNGLPRDSRLPRPGRKRFMHGSGGIVGTYPGPVEVTAVFPELSSTIITHDQELRFKRGDDVDLHVSVQNDKDPPDPVGTFLGVFRFAAKQSNEDPPGSDLVLKHSFNPAEIEQVKPNLGQVVVHIRAEDTQSLPPIPGGVWDLELTLPRNVNGLVTLPDGVTASVFTHNPCITILAGFSWIDLGARIGDILIIQGRRVLIEEVTAAQVRAEFDGWTTEAGLEFQLYHANRKTIASGLFVVERDVVR